MYFTTSWILEYNKLLRGEFVPFAGPAMKKKHRKASSFVVCIRNEDYKASLEVGKLYRVIPDEEAASHGYIRVIDESGEDYGYVADRFFRSKSPKPWQTPYG